MKKYSEFLKSIIITMGSQALLYFLIKLFLHDYNVMNTFVDIPFIKGFIYVYDSWYPVILLSAFIIYYYDKKTYITLIFTMILGAFLSHITFLIYPTMVIRPEITVNNLTDFIVDISYKTDTPAVNCLPSVHCLYCFIISYYMIKCNNLKTKYKVLIITYLFTIVLSTLFVKQHIIEDAILSLIYTIIAIIIIYFSKDKIKKLLGFKI